jgi:hypothetical protein
MTRDKKGKYWYHFYIVECVLCGVCDEDRERRYTTKPKDKSDRYEYRQTACDCHFM